MQMGQLSYDPYAVTFLHKCSGIADTKLARCECANLLPIKFKTLMHVSWGGDIYYILQCYADSTQ
jgi:hypothetical protein